MADQRIEKLARIIVEHSIKVKKGEKVMIDASAEAAPLILELYKQIMLKGAIPLPRIGIPGTAYHFFNNASDEQLKHFPETFMYEMKRVDSWIGISSAENLKELSRVDPKKITLRGKVTKQVHDERLRKKWVIVAHPTAAFAQAAEMSVVEFEDFLYGACIQDWKKIGKKMEKLKKALERAKSIRIVSKDTDIRFSTKGRKWVIDGGEHNMPGGEVFTAPVEKSVEGHIQFDFPAISAGKELKKVYFEFDKGKVVNATAEKNQDYLHALLKIDKGSSYIGECGIGYNYNIKQHIKQILFDEKIGGTVHFAIGAAYKECKGVNKSSIHVDLIKDLRKGGKIYADKKLIQDRGKFFI